MAAILDDALDPSSSQPIIYTSSCRAHHRLSTKGKSFAKYCTKAETQGRSSINPPIVPQWGGGGDFAYTC